KTFLMDLAANTDINGMNFSSCLLTFSATRSSHQTYREDIFALIEIRGFETDEGYDKSMQRW
ncbi:3037_t:CDS:1, partial [Paraglomus brasilianum]